VRRQWNLERDLPEGTRLKTLASLSALGAVLLVLSLLCCATSRPAAANSQRDSGSSNSVVYDPCPPKGTPCKILALGDSITAGVGSTTNGSYRVDLFRKARQNGQTITFVGSMQGGPPAVDGVPFPAANEGHSGYTIDDGGGHPGIAPLVVTALNRYQPHIVTLMIGTNDVGIQLDLSNAPARLGALIDTIQTAAPAALVVVAQITPIVSEPDDARVATYNAAMPALVASRAAAGKHILLVDMHSAFKKNPNFAADFMRDNLHPKDAGYTVMSDVWYAAIGPLLR
jgi:lysophospholipase L1-like esterase